MMSRVLSNILVFEKRFLSKRERLLVIRGFVLKMLVLRRFSMILSVVGT